MSISFWLDNQQTKKAVSCDCAIVGSGIAGLSLAYWLEKNNPGVKIIILERNTLGFGASSRNGGFVTCGSVEHFSRLIDSYGEQKASEIWNFSDQSRELMKEHIIQNDTAEIQFTQPGIATLAIDETQSSRFQKSASIMSKNGIPVEEISSSQIKTNYGLDGYRSGVLFKGDGQMHPAAFLRKLRTKSNAQLLENEEVFEIKNNNCIITQNYEIECQKVFLTVNAYLPLLAPEFSKLITPQRGQVLVTAPISKHLFGPAYITHNLAYIRQLKNGELLIGGFRTRSAKTEETYADQTRPEIQEALENYIYKHFGKTEITHRWSGTMGFTPDHQMLIGEHPSRKNLYLMAGCSGLGMGISFNAAKVLADACDAATNSATKKAIPAYLDVARFAGSIVA